MRGNWNCSQARIRQEIRHLDVEDLWVQQKFCDRNVDLVKVLGTESAADLPTTDVAADTWMDVLQQPRTATGTMAGDISAMQNTCFCCCYTLKTRVLQETENPLLLLSLMVQVGKA